MEMSKSSKRWLQEHNRDRYVNLARNRQLRSRAVFKLEELDRRHKLFRPGQTVLDLGAAPGSWSAYAVEKVGPGGKVIAVDLLDMQPIVGVTFLQADLNDAERLQYCIAELGENSVDLVISDMAPNLSGIAAVDQAGSLNLAESACRVACSVLRENGHFLVKLFQGGGSAAFRKQLVKKFDKVMQAKPRASRANSSELYLLAKGYNM
ncbi:MAG: RlmE family RNA methyltransferase [Gammaproteobacteria bacterium]|nr:RlmE family RNA methyltransferase [Gammaproteobacteria bacterium]